jgi:hypothetical protein
MVLFYAADSKHLFVALGVLIRKSTISPATPTLNPTGNMPTPSIARVLCSYQAKQQKWAASLGLSSTDLMLLAFIIVV